jgi:hypothetical protein
VIRLHRPSNIIHFSMQISRLPLDIPELVQQALCLVGRRPAPFNDPLQFTSDDEDAFSAFRWNWGAWFSKRPTGEISASDLDILQRSRLDLLYLVQQALCLLACRAALRGDLLQLFPDLAKTLDTFNGYRGDEVSIIVDRMTLLVHFGRELFFGQISSYGFDALQLTPYLLKFSVNPYPVNFVERAGHSIDLGWRSLACPRLGRLDQILFLLCNRALNRAHRFAGVAYFGDAAGRFTDLAHFAGLARKRCRLGRFGRLASQCSGLAGFGRCGGRFGFAAADYQ